MDTQSTMATLDHRVHVMKIVGVKVQPALGKSGGWDCACGSCGFASVEDDLHGAMRIARRHIKECQRPAEQNKGFEYGVLTRTWEHWIIGFM